jgi:AraC family transcriptional regulator
MPDKASAGGDGESAAGERGLAICRAAASDATPKYLKQVIENLDRTPTRVLGVDASSSLKISFWDTNLPEYHIDGDLNYLSVVLQISGGRIWLDEHPTPGEPGAVGMQPFDKAIWRFEGAISYLPVYIPFVLIGAVSESLFDRELRHEQIWVPPGTRDPNLCRAMRAIQSSCLSTIAPTNLILDSWSLVLSEILLRRFSSYADRYGRASFGKIPGRAIALAVDYIEANLDQDLRLATLAKISGMSTYHFARRFKETVGMSPHAYVVLQRIRRAQDMLNRNGSSLANVATTCGFASQAHFTTVFQRSLGVTPGQYRRAVGEL